MRTKIFTLLLVLLSIANFSLAQDWEKTFLHDTGIAKGFDVIQTSDNGYVMVGEVDLPTGAIRHYIWLVKTDNDGNELWSRVYSGGGVFNNIAQKAGKAIIEDANGDLFIAGSNWNKASVFKTSATGDSLWTKDFGGQGINSFQDIVQDANGNLILVGQYETALSSNLNEVWVMGMNTAGDSLWSERYFDPTFGNTSAMDISPLSSNDFLVTGTLGDQGFSLKIDGADGTQAWSNTYQLGNSDNLFSGVINSDETGLLIGGMISGIAGFSPVLFETNAEGVFENNALFSSVPFGAITSIAPTNDDGFILTGSSFDFWNQTTTMNIGFATKLDADLAVEWELTFEDSLTKQGASIRQNEDGSYILAGSRAGGMWLKKIMGISTSTDELATENMEIKVQPNPAYQTISLVIPESTNTDNLSMTIYDNLGRLVATNRISRATNLIDVGQLPRGMYYYTIQDGTVQLSSGKLLLHNIKP